MSVVKKFILEDVRCFEGEQVFDIRPLTFLVGENSTGKSTVLGCMQALGDFAGYRQKKYPFDFNVDPYRMGAYVDIARKVGSRGGGRSRQFCLGFEIQIGAGETMDLRVTLVERETGSEPVIKKLELEFDDGILVFEITNHARKDQPVSPFSAISRLDKNTTNNGKSGYIFKVAGEEGLFYTLRHFGFYDPRDKKNKEYKEVVKFLKNIVPRLSKEDASDIFYDIRGFLPPYREIYFESFAPVRSRPVRTYDPVKEVEDPEGSGMPVTLMNLYRKDKETWEKRRQKLVKFGKASGLFTDIGIRQHGRSVNDPFQLQIKVNGPKTNITDVGYGVSQILPVLVRIFNARRETTFLVQQPEVHLHPRGQAELVSLLTDMKSERGNSFIVETHSDAMINRARIEIMKGKLKPEDVSLIYLEPAGNQVDVHNISFDTSANMSGVPGSYRDFFLKEQDRLLGFEI